MKDDLISRAEALYALGEEPPVWHDSEAEISDRNQWRYDVEVIKEFFKEYNGCRNCRHQPEPMQMCEWGKKRQRVELICSGWEKKDE